MNNRHGTSIERRLQRMYKQTQKWIPENDTERHDRKLLIHSLHFAITGRTKIRKVNNVK